MNVGFGALAGTLMPVAIGIAVLRYRLYEIDVLLNRAVLYGLLTAGVAAVYLAVVAVCGLGVRHRPATFTVQVVATVVAAAALFPLRDRVQRRVDRLFYGDRGAPYDALARLGRRVEEAGGHRIGAGFRGQDDRGQPAAALRGPRAAARRRVAARGRVRPGPAEVVAFPLISQRETVGRLLVGTRSRASGSAPTTSGCWPTSPARRARPPTRWRCARRWMRPGRAWSPRGKRNGGGCGATCTTGWGRRWPG